MSEVVIDDEATLSGSSPREHGHGDPIEVDDLDRLGRYMISSRLGAGSMGMVFSAWDPELDRKVAIKFLRMDKSANEESRHRLLREAQAMARLDHPNVIGIHDVGEYAGRVYLVMTFVSGQTLSAWLEQGPRSWREIVEVFRQAGHGLVAAHRADLVHRDFKPDNVMIDDAGHVQVMDFGLARATGAEQKQVRPQQSGRFESISLTGTLESSVTERGALVGTPAYMAPELFVNHPADQRSDQFAFCVALYRALFRQRPFGNEDLPSLVLALTEGQLRELPARPRIPSRLRELIERGLSVDPERRWADMASVVAILEREPVLARPWPIAIASAIALAGLLALFGGVTISQRRPLPVCTGAEARLVGVWDAQRRETLSAGFGRIEATWSAHALAVVTARFDDYARTWVLAHRDACEATRLRGEQSEAALDLRMRCLEHGRRELDAIVEVLESGDREALERAVTAADGLPKLERCSELDALADESALPEDEDAAAEAEAIIAALDRVMVLERTGQYEAGLELARGLEARAEQLGYAPTRVELGYAFGSLLSASGDFEGAAERLEESFHMALSGDLRPLAGKIALHQALLVGERLAQPEQGWFWLRLAESLLGPDDQTLAKIASYRAALIYRGGDYEQALNEYRRGIELLEGSGRVSSDLAAMYNGLGLTLLRLVRSDEGTVALERSVELMAEALGAEHPKVSTTLINLASAYAQRGSLDQALATYEQAAAVIERELGPMHPNLGVIYVNVAGIARRLGELERAGRSAARALAIYRERYGAEHPKVAIALRVSSSVELAAGELEAAEAHARESVEIMRVKYGDDHAQLAPPMLSLAQVLHAKGESLVALELVDEAMGMSEGGGSFADIVTLRERIHRRLARPPGGESELLAALGVCEEVDCGAPDHAELSFARARQMLGTEPGAAVVMARGARDSLVDDPTKLGEELRTELRRWLDAPG